MLMTKGCRIQRLLQWSFACVLLSLLVVSPFSTGQTLEGKLSLTISSNKQVFVNGEMIYLDVIEENLTDSQLSVSYWSERDVKIIDWQNADVRYYGPVIDEKSARFIIPPRAKVQRSLGLIRYGNVKDRTGIAVNYSPGKYRVWIQDGSIKSNTFEFMITTRSAEEELVHKEMGKLVANYRSRREAISECRYLIHAYPQSVFLPNIYWELITFLQMSEVPEDANGLAETSLEFIRRFPNFGGLSVPVNYYRLALQRQLGISRHGVPTAAQAKVIEGKLEQIRSTHSTSKVAQYVNSEVENAKREWSTEK